MERCDAEVDAVVKMEDENVVMIRMLQLLVEDLILTILLKDHVLMGFELTNGFESVDRVDGCGCVDTLIDVSTGVIVDSKHGHNAIGHTIRTPNVGILASNVRDMNTDPACPFGDLCDVGNVSKDAVHIVGRGREETRRQLRS